MACMRKTNANTEASADKSGAGLCVYIGPTIIGTIQRNTIYPGTKEVVLQSPALKLTGAMLQYIAPLVVPGDKLAGARIKVKTKGDPLYKAYRQLIKMKKEEL